MSDIMSEQLICPVCETPNAPASTHCEVCGERLAPPAPGEVLSPEESVMATIQQEAAAAAAAPAAPAAAGGFAMDDEDDFDFAGGGGQMGIDPVDAPISFDDGGMMGIDPVDAPISFEQPPSTSPEPAAITDKPAVLYSVLSGEAFYPGSAEYEDGYGPMGEELVSERPADLGAIEEPAAVEVAPAPAATPVATPAAAPLPTPGPHAEPATLTVYVNRQPVHTHKIDTDETLIGRKDIRADVYPDIDLTEYDSGSVISRKHAYVYRQNKNYTLYAVSNGGLQLNSELLDLGQRRPLKDGDIIIVAGVIAIKFKLP